MCNKHAKKHMCKIYILVKCARNLSFHQLKKGLVDSNRYNNVSKEKMYVLK